MKKRIVLILVLMSTCVTGITCLQLYWNYQNYKATVKTFKHDINEALIKAADKEKAMRQQQIITRVKDWMADTSFITITCFLAGRDSSTVFHITDSHPYEKGQKGIQFGITDFKEKLHQLTPAAKTYVINFFADTMVKKDFRQGVVYFYTQRLGDSLQNLVDKSRHNQKALNNFYKAELAAMDINADFELNPVKIDKQTSFLTRTLNAGIQAPHQKDMVFAVFQSPGSYFFKEMKWLLISSLLLICITIFCYAYTVKTIFTQQKLAELKNDFVNNMTHELKTPVATINIAAEAIQDFNLSKASADEYLGIIRYQAGNLTNLIDQILKSVVAEQDTVKINLSPANVTGLINHLIYDYSPQITAAKATVNYQADNNCKTVMADAPLLKNAIANLLDNAIKYGGTETSIRQFMEKGALIISISDNGPGIPSQYQDKVFDRFFRVPSGDIHNVKGYGLGLSYARSIIEKHGGTLTLTSNEGQRTEFIISLSNIYHETSQGIIA